MNAIVSAPDEWGLRHVEFTGPNGHRWRISVAGIMLAFRIARAIERGDVAEAIRLRDHSRKLPRDDRVR